MSQRLDIQALRGFAVLLVVVYHAKLLPIHGGYLGVDIFFVISGYLITLLIARGLQDGTFSFASFYYRRARRLLPAAYATIILCVAASPFLLNSAEARDFSIQVLGALTFSANIVLWQQSGYFEGAAELKPLLHMWSLAIEEQYYLILPALLVFTKKRYWLLGALGVLFVSLILCFVLGPVKPGAVFYLLPTRAWEMSIGSVAALARYENIKLDKWLKLSVWPAIAALLIIPAFPISKIHPGLDAVIVCLATIVVVLARYEFNEKNYATQALAKVGNISYSLYLIHWPIIAFLNNANIGGGGLWWPVRFGAVVLSLSAAYLIYRFIELRYRLVGYRIISLSSVNVFVFLSILIVSSAFFVGQATRSDANYAERLRSNVGLAPKCEIIGDFVALPECRNSNSPSMLVWGDSYAMHLVPGLADTPGSRIMQATRSTCSPVLGVALFSAPKYPRTWSQNCIQFNRDVLESIRHMPSIDVVVLAGNWDSWLGGNVIVQSGSNYSEDIGGIDLAVSKMRETIAEIRATGKHVIVVEPPPASGFDIGRCQERKSSEKISFGAPPNCLVSVLEWERKSALTNEFLKRVKDEASVNVFSFRKYLCDTTFCNSRLDQTLIYRDPGHLSVEGSIELAKRSSLLHEFERLSK